MYISVVCELFLNLYLFGLIGSRMFIQRGSVFFNQIFTILENMFLDFISLTVLCIILFWEERDIKCEKNTYIPLFLTEIDNRKLTEVISDGQSVKF